MFVCLFVCLYVKVVHLGVGVFVCEFVTISCLDVDWIGKPLLCRMFVIVEVSVGGVFVLVGVV
jgi:hypothetical protein